MFKELNKTVGVIAEGTKLEEMEFKKLRDFIGKTLPVSGFFFTNGDYGKQVVIITDDAKVNMPNRAVEVFERISESEEMKAAVLAGHLRITDIAEKKGKRGKFIAFTLADR